MSLSNYRYISGLLFDQPWAIAAPSLNSIIHLVETHGQADLEAVAAKLGRPLDNTGNRVEMRGSVAVLDIHGPIFRYANLFAMISGATSVELLARDFQSALDNPQVESILLRVDSVGGEVAGIADLADQIRAGNARKPVTAFIDDWGASAAYWLASAAGKVYGSESSFSGSIGIVASYTDRRSAQEKQGVKEWQIVSSQSPLKNPDIATEDGRAQIKEMVDSLAALFIGRVAKFRGVEPEHVIANFGRGSLRAAPVAQKAGMIDGISTEEALIASLNHNSKEEISVSANSTPSPVTEPVDTSVLVGTVKATVITTPATTERQRIRDILALPEAQGHEALARAFATESDLTAEQAKKMLAAAAAAQTTPATPAPSALEREMAKIPNPDVGVGRDEDTPVAEAARILAFLPDHRKIKQAS